jgi:hypothetical protein
LNCEGQVLGYLEYFEESWKLRLQFAQGRFCEGSFELFLEKL